MRILARWRAGRSVPRCGTTSPAVARHASDDLATVLFRDPSLADRLRRDGFAVVDGFLTAPEVAEADAVFAQAAERLGGSLGDSWFPTILLPDEDLRAFITERLTAIVTPRLGDLVVPSSVEVLRVDYSVKPPSPTSDLGPHQDYAVVDESTAESLYLWIPLCDTDERNGTLHVVPGSHRFTNKIRSRHVGAVFDEVLDEVHESSVAIDCAAGDLVLMVSGVVHFSPPNLSDRLRLAVHGIAKPVGVPLVFYYEDEQTPTGKVECYELDIDAYVRAIRSGRPGLDDPMCRLEDRPESSMSPARFAQGMSDYRSSVASAGQEPGRRPLLGSRDGRSEES